MHLIALGDPVFSNILLTPENKVVLIDVRGRQGDLFTTEGDAMYDLAKVLQSSVDCPEPCRFMLMCFRRLQGYDFALLTNPKTAPKASMEELVSPVDRRLLNEYVLPH